MTTPVPNAETLASIVLHHEVSSFLFAEAAVLDDDDYDGWLDLLTTDVRYRMPVRVTSMRGQEEVSSMDHFDEDRYSLEKRVKRLAGKHAWTEDPRSRTRRFVTNVRVDDPSDDGNVTVRSSLLLFRSRLDDRPPEWVSASRRDVLRRVEGRLRLADRTITVDEAVLRTQNLAVFL
jgi:phthalate 3,4-dioxygenase subunit beta